MQTVAFTAGEYGDFLFLVCAGEVEARQVCTGIYVASAHAERLDTLAYYLIYGAFGDEVVVRLVDVC